MQERRKWRVERSWSEKKYTMWHTYQQQLTQYFVGHLEELYNLSGVQQSAVKHTIVISFPSFLCREIGKSIFSKPNSFVNPWTLKILGLQISWKNLKYKDYPPWSSKHFHPLVAVSCSYFYTRSATGSHAGLVLVSMAAMRSWMLHACHVQRIRFSSNLLRHLTFQIFPSPFL